MDDAHAEKSRRQMQPVQHRTSDGARPRTARRLPGRPVLKPVVPASETLARSTPFRNSSRNSTSPHLNPLTTTWAPQQGNALLEPALRPLPAPTLPCPALPHSDPRHLHLTSRPSVQPPCSCCCSVFEDHLALALRPPPAINALPTHPYLVATVRYARPRLKHHPQSQERHVCSCLCSCWLVCGCVRLGTVRLTFQGPLHGMASHRVRPIASQQHPIPSHRIGFDLSFDTCAVILCVCYAVWLCWPRPGPNSTCCRIAATCPLGLPLPLTCCLLCLTCYKSATEPRFSTQRDRTA